MSYFRKNPGMQKLSRWIKHFKGSRFMDRKQCDSKLKPYQEKHLLLLENLRDSWTQVTPWISVICVITTAEPYCIAFDCLVGRKIDLLRGVTDADSVSCTYTHPLEFISAVFAQNGNILISPFARVGIFKLLHITKIKTGVGPESFSSTLQSQDTVAVTGPFSCLVNIRLSLYSILDCLNAVTITTIAKFRYFTVLAILFRPTYLMSSSIKPTACFV